MLPDINIIILLISGVILCSNLIVDYSGPLNIFDRLRDYLLPGIKPAKPLHLSLNDLSDITKVKQWASDIKEYDLATENYINYKHYPYFSNSLKCTIYEILRCKFCVLPYLSFTFTFIIFIPEFYLIANSQFNILTLITTLTNLFILSLGVGGGGFIYNKWIQPSNL